MKRVTGIGGIFFKAKDPDKLREWYRVHLGIESESWGGLAFQWQDDPQPDGGSTVWTIFRDDTKYFAPSDKPFMINFRVEDLGSLLTQLRAEGVEVEGNAEESEFGRFGWLMDPEGNRVELWQPPPRSGE
jgi:predicted enzyme related to lactoylglutathione lyase